MSENPIQDQQPLTPEPQVRQKPDTLVDAQVIGYVNSVFEASPNKYKLRPEAARILVSRDYEVDPVAEESSFSYQGYLGYLRAQGGGRAPEIQRIKSFLDAYEEHKPFVDRVRDEAKSFDKPEDNPSHLGGGVAVNSYEYEKDGKKYVFRVPHNYKQSTHDFYSRIRGLLRVDGIPNVEQIVALSFEDVGVVTEKLPGISVKNLPPEQAELVTGEHIKSLVKILQKIHEVGAHHETNADNFLFDPELGFSLVDVSSGPAQQIDTYEALEYIMYSFGFTSNKQMFAEGDPKRKKQIEIGIEKVFAKIVDVANELLSTEEVERLFDEPLGREMLRAKNFPTVPDKKRRFFGKKK